MMDHEEEIKELQERKITLEDMDKIIRQIAEYIERMKGYNFEELRQDISVYSNLIQTMTIDIHKIKDATSDHQFKDDVLAIETMMGQISEKMDVPQRFFKDIHDELSKFSQNIEEIRDISKDLDQGIDFDRYTDGMKKYKNDLSDSLLVMKKSVADIAEKLRDIQSDADAFNTNISSGKKDIGELFEQHCHALEENIHRFETQQKAFVEKTKEIVDSMSKIDTLQERVDRIGRNVDDALEKKFDHVTDSIENVTQKVQQATGEKLAQIYETNNTNHQQITDLLQQILAGQKSCTEEPENESGVSHEELLESHKKLNEVITILRGEAIPGPENRDAVSWKYTIKKWPELDDMIERICEICGVDRLV